MLPRLSTDTTLLSGLAVQRNDHNKCLGNKTADVHCCVEHRQPKIISLTGKLIFSLTRRSGTQNEDYILLSATFST